MRVHVTVDAGGILRELDFIARAQSGLDLGVVASTLLTHVDDKIQAEGAFGGFPRWHELSHSVLERRPGAHMLQRSGALANMQPRVVSRSVEVRSPPPYAGFHLTGTKTVTGGVRMPRRDFFEIDMDAALEEAGLRVLERLAP